MTVSTNVDLTGLKCPMPIVHLNRVVRTVEPGHELTVTANDPAFALDVAAWCRRTGNDLCSLDTSDGTLTAIIRVGGEELEASE